MANNPTMTEHSANLLNALNFYHRNGQYPLDDTSLWNTLAEFQSYIQETGSYRYPGQLVSITNGDAYDESNDKLVSLAIVRPNGEVQKVGEELIFESTTAAETFITNNPDFATAGKTLAVKAADGVAYELYIIKTDKSIQRISFEASDIPEVSWDALTGKPTSSVADIDASVILSKRFTESGGTLSFDGAALAKVSDIPTAYDANLITGTIKVENLPQAALERLYVAENDAARKKLTKTQVQNGDVVKVTDTGLMYYIKDDTKLSADGVADAQDAAFEPFTAGAASTVPWSGVTGTPTTLDGYGITDAVKSADVQQTYTEDGKVVAWKQGTDANTNTYNIEGKAKEAALADVATMGKDAEKLGGQLPAYYATAESVTTLSGTVSGINDRVTTAEGEIDTLQADVTSLKNGSGITSIGADKISGVINEANLPDSVKTKIHEVANEAARFQLTATEVQTGDIVKQLDTGALFFVKDSEQLSNAAGYEPISVTELAWEKITGKPTTVADSGLTDALADGDVSTTYAAGKVVGWEQGTNDTTSTQYDINGTAKKATEADQAIKALDADKLGNQTPDYYATAQSVTDLTGRVGTAESDIYTMQAQIGDGSGSGILKDIADLKSGTAITEVAAEKIVGVLDIENLPPAAVERLYIVEDETALESLTTANVQNGDTVKVQDSGLMYFVKDDTKLGTVNYMQGLEPYTVGQASQVPWTGVTGKPNNLSGYGITDAVNVSEKVTVANAGNAGKILVLNAEGKLDVDITGSVAWEKILNKPTSSVAQIDAAVTAATHTNRTVLDALSDIGGALAYNGNVLAKQTDLEATNTTVAQHTTKIAQLGLGVLSIVDNADTEMADAAEGQFVLERVAAG